MVIEKILQEPLRERNAYLDRIQSYIWSPLIKVLIGQRRVGKSSIIKSLIQNFVKSWIPKENIFYINKELSHFDFIENYDDLKQSFFHFLDTGIQGKIIIAIDEIQEIQWWEKFINGTLAEYGTQAEIFITGSNSFLVSGDLATYLTGRYIEFPIFPLSFTEFCDFKNIIPSKNEFYEYLQYGGLPAIFTMHYSQEVIFPYLYGVYNTIVMKDILQYREIRNIDFFQNLYKYTLANIWSLVSASSIQKYLRSQQIKIGNDTILNFLYYACEAFVLYKVWSVNPNTKKSFEIYNKYYVGDLWLRNALVGYDFSRDIWKLLENYVFLELKRQGYDIQIWRLDGEREVDFIASKQWIIKYFQVAYTLNGEETLHREYASLQDIWDNWEKYIISMDEHNISEHEGIKHINILELESIL